MSDAERKIDYCALAREHLTAALAMVNGAILSMDTADRWASRRGTIDGPGIIEKLEEIKELIAYEHIHAESLGYD